MNAKASKKMGKRVRATYVVVLEALKTNNCISSYSISENDVQANWEDGGIDRAVQEVTTNPKPFGLNRSQRGGLLMVLPQKAREKADGILLGDFKKKYGMMLMLLFLTLSMVSAQQTNSNVSATDKIADLRMKAENGDVRSQYELGVAFDFGKLGLEKNYTEAVKWFRKAAEQNNAAAQDNLGQCYAAGEGVEQDYAGAAKWYRKAAEQNDNSAQYDLGLCYANGEGVSKNYAEAYKWWTLAADQNNSDAKKYLSVLAGNMSPDQIAEGQKLVQNFVPQKTPTTWVSP